MKVIIDISKAERDDILGLFDQLDTLEWVYEVVH